MEVGVVDLDGVPLGPENGHLLVVVDLHHGKSGASHGELDRVAPHLRYRHYNLTNRRTA